MHVSADDTIPVVIDENAAPAAKLRPYHILAVVPTIGLGLLARRGNEMSLEQWSVGGRGFGTIFVFLLMAGEIYTTFTFLGGSGWSHGRGAPAFYILCYGMVAYSFSGFLLPIIWRYAHRRQRSASSHTGCRAVRGTMRRP